ncbi:MAG: hypothetical protein IPL99_15995 [Candidatus Competibacteraceae bacterium]|nr:hypothetical protein [Candidatus Competibacteraceae bacterium]
MEIVGEMLGHDGDKTIWDYFRRHWAAWFPGLGDRSTFVRPAANLWRIKPLLHERWVGDLGARAADGHITSTASPLPSARWRARCAARF